MMGLASRRVRPVILPVLAVLVLLCILESVLHVSGLSLGRNKSHQASLRAPFAYVLGGPSRSFARPIEPARGGPLRRGPSRLFAADSRVPSGSYDRLRRLVDIKQQEVGPSVCTNTNQSPATNSCRWGADDPSLH